MVGKDGDRSRKEALWPEMGRYAGLGLQLVVVIGLFGAGGWWVDERLGTTPLLTIMGTMGGAAAWFYSLYRHLVIDMRRRDSKGGGPPSGEGGSR